MNQYKELVTSILENGTMSKNRTGIDTIRIAGQGELLKFDLQKGFPILTIKQVNYKSAFAELCGFLRGYTHATQFRALGTNVWNANANENESWVNSPYRHGKDDMGRVYGYQWRKWQSHHVVDVHDVKMCEALESDGYRAILKKGNFNVYWKKIDQLKNCLKQIINEPNSRRIIFTAWNVGELEQMCLPPCHVLYQFIADEATRELSLHVTIRSSDVGLGLPFNMVQSGALLTLFARLTGYKPRWLNLHLNDAHIYLNHVQQLLYMAEREPYPLPKLRLDSALTVKTMGYEHIWLDEIRPDHFIIENYQHHPAVRLEMAV